MEDGIARRQIPHGVLMAWAAPLNLRGGFHPEQREKL
jgi:hypothetical protein